jgi:hypothetical protein
MASFTCCTWNVENLFRPGQGDGPDDEDLYRAKLAYLAWVLGALGPDVVALQEVASDEALADLKAEAGYRHAAASSHPDPRGIRVAFLSRLKPSWTGELSPFPDQALLRLRADTDTPAEGIDLKSRRPGRARRRLESAAPPPGSPLPRLRQRPAWTPAGPRSGCRASGARAPAGSKESRVTVPSPGGRPPLTRSPAPHRLVPPHSGGQSTPASPQLFGELVHARGVDRRVELAQEDASRVQRDARGGAFTAGVPELRQVHLRHREVEAAPHAGRPSGSRRGGRARPRGLRSPGLRGRGPAAPRRRPRGSRAAR